MTPDSVIDGVPGCIECDFGEGLVILNTDSNVYFRLNAVGKVVWSLITQPDTDEGVTVERLVSEVTDTFDVCADRCRSDVEALLEKMQENRLVRIEQAARV